MIAGSVPLQVIVWRTIARERVATATRLSALVGLVGLALIDRPERALRAARPRSGCDDARRHASRGRRGSFVSGRLPLPRDTFVATVYEMLGGGAVLTVAALALGEGGELGDASAASVAAWLYLAVAGSLIAFTAYAWLLRNAPISQVVTHQYVNPLVAIALGSVLLGETLDATTALGAADRDRRRLRDDSEREPRRCADCRHRAAPGAVAPARGK